MVDEPTINGKSLKDCSDNVLRVAFQRADADLAAAIRREAEIRNAMRAASPYRESPPLRL